MSSSNFLSIVSVLSASELTLGSYLHFLHIPLTGQLMSLNQCFWLNVSKIWSPEDSALKISLQVAAVKIMTPIGKRLTPMLAIAMQGLLFETGCWIFGRQLLGKLAGSILMSFWSFLQPALIYSLLLGNSLMDMAHFFSDKTGMNVWTGIFLLVWIKASFAIAVSLSAHFLAPRVQVIERYGSWLESLKERLMPKPSSRPQWKKIFFSPFFISFVLINVYLYFKSETIEYFLRQSLFYFFWMIAVFYLLNYLEGGLMRFFGQKAKADY